MLLTVSSAGWRRPSSELQFERVHALRPQSHLELSWVIGPSGETLGEVWASLYFTEPQHVQRLLIHQMDARDLEWRFEFRGDYDPLKLVLGWNGIQEDTGEVTLIRQGIQQDLLGAIGAERPA